MTGQATDSPDGPADAARPLLKVVSPDATPEEIAALVAVLASLGGEEPAQRRPARAWSSPARGVRRSLPHGRGGWRASSLPG